MKKYIAVTRDGHIVGSRQSKKDILAVAAQQTRQLQETIDVKQLDPWTVTYVLITERKPS